MEPENIDWKNIEVEFEEDEKYESFDAPKWVDFLALDHNQIVDHQSWFCNSNCNHSITPSEFAAQMCKVQLLRSLSISKILNQSDVKSNVTKISKQNSQKAKGLDENKNPNTFHFSKTNSTRKHNLDNLPENGPNSQGETRLKSTFLGHNLVAGREIIGHIAGFCTNVKRLAKNKGPESGLGSVLGELKQRVKDKERERTHLLVREE